MSSSNNPGKIADMNTNIKQFYTSSAASPWVYKKSNTSIEKAVITTATINDVLIPSDLYVSGSIYTPSDARLKNILKPIDLEQNDLDVLNPILFTYKSDSMQTPHFGFSAQEVEQVYPFLVENARYSKHVNYQELIPLMVAKMKCMQRDLNELKNQMK